MRCSSRSSVSRKPRLFGQPGEGVGAGGVVEPPDQRLDTLPHHAREHRGDGERAHHDKPPHHDPVARGMKPEQGLVEHTRMAIWKIASRLERK